MKLVLLIVAAVLIYAVWAPAHQWVDARVADYRYRSEQAVLFKYERLGIIQFTNRAPQ